MARTAFRAGGRTGAPNCRCSARTTDDRYLQTRLSACAGHPTSALFDGLDELDAYAAQTAPRPARAAFGQFLTWLRATPPTEVAQHYVETFDLRRRCALYLTYYRYGDTRKRGMAMIAFKTAYRDAGFVPSGQELPDYLPMVLA